MATVWQIQTIIQSLNTKFIQSTIIFSQSHQFFIVKIHSRWRHVSSLQSHHQAVS